MCVARTCGKLSGLVLTRLNTCFAFVFLVPPNFSSKYCVPHLKKGTNPHILNISPPLNMNPRWFKDHVGKFSLRSMFSHFIMLFSFQLTRWQSTACPCVRWRWRKSSRTMGLLSTLCGLEQVCRWMRAAHNISAVECTSHLIWCL